MKRSHKIKVISRYLTAYSGIPLISWDGIGQELEAPNPYRFVVSTDASNQRFLGYVHGLPHAGINAVIRYDSFIDGVEDAVVGMKLPTFTTLLSAHYGTISDSIITDGQGD